MIETPTSQTEIAEITGTTEITHTETGSTRSASLRALAEGADPIVATAFRRRAAELEFQAWLEEVHTGSTVTVESALGEAA